VKSNFWILGVDCIDSLENITCLATDGDWDLSFNPGCWEAEVSYDGDMGARRVSSKDLFTS